MTPNEVITLINTDLPTNGNNEITASVLRPVLIAMVEQINELVGDASNLPEPYTNVISALNGIEPQGIQVLTGEDNPNDTPPGDFNLGDFYSQTSGVSIIAFWQYTGNYWVQVLSRYQQKLRFIKTISGNYTVLLDEDDIIIYNGSTAGATITLPNVLLAQNKYYTLVNASDFELKTTAYNNLEGVSTIQLFENSVLTLLSNGTNWQQINNNDISAGS